MDQDKQKQHRKNMIVAWSIGILVVILYVTSIYYGVNGE